MQLHYYHNKPVELRLPDKKIIVGVVAGVTCEGQLTLKTANGLQNFAIGDISLRSRISG
jgi:biotin-(acetyl-CoA carboxylase) ligase